MKNAYSTYPLAARIKICIATRSRRLMLPSRIDGTRILTNGRIIQITNCSIWKREQFIPWRRSQTSGCDSRSRWTWIDSTTRAPGITSSTFSLSLVVSWAFSDGSSRLSWLHGTQTPSTTSWSRSCTKCKRHPGNILRHLKITMKQLLWNAEAFLIVASISSRGFRLRSNSALGVRLRIGRVLGLS